MVSPSGEWFRKTETYGSYRATPTISTIFSPILYCRRSAKMLAASVFTRPTT